MLLVLSPLTVTVLVVLKVEEVKLKLQEAKGAKLLPQVELTRLILAEGIIIKLVAVKLVELFVITKAELVWLIIKVELEGFADKLTVELSAPLDILSI